MTRSPAFREYRVRLRGQLADRWALRRASANHLSVISVFDGDACALFDGRIGVDRFPTRPSVPPCSRPVRPVGGAKRQVDVLLVSATNANLDESITKGRFRSDLLFRLNTLEVTLPALRERSDFTEIARYLIEKIDPSADLTQSAIDRLAELDWDGNIRELRNVLSRLSLGEHGNQIDEAAVESVVEHSFGERLPGKAPGNGGP